MNSLSDVFREEPIPFVIYNNDLRSKSNVILHLRKKPLSWGGGWNSSSFILWRKKSDETFSLISYIDYFLYE